jgi:hypothetical protein
VAAIHEDDGEHLVGLSDELQVQVVAHGGGTRQAGTGLEETLLQQGDGLPDDPVFVLGGDEGQ